MVVKPIAAIELDTRHTATRASISPTDEFRRELLFCAKPLVASRRQRRLQAMANSSFDCLSRTTVKAAIITIMASPPVNKSTPSTARQIIVSSSKVVPSFPIRLPAVKHPDMKQRVCHVVLIAPRRRFSTTCDVPRRAVSSVGIAICTTWIREGEILQSSPHARM